VYREQQDLLDTGSTQTSYSQCELRIISSLVQQSGRSNVMNAKDRYSTAEVQRTAAGWPTAEKGHSANVALRVIGRVWRFHLLEKTLASTFGPRHMLILPLSSLWAAVSDDH